MGLFDKIKNMFTEEVDEDDDVKVEKIKNDVTHVSIESPKIEIEDKKNEEEIEFLEFHDESKPIFFDDNDFNDLNLNDKARHESKIEIEEKEIYGSRIKEEKHEIEEKKVFKPTPIISPVYGVLDKNYHKEDIVSRDDVKNENPIKESPIDSIRNKAYGTLEDELENTLFGSNSILFKKDDKEELEIKEVNDEVLTDLTDDISKELDELIVKKEQQVEKVETTKNKKEENVEDEDLLGFIDSTLYKDGDE